jgi:predicted RNase H-like nuclease (RuvC/YqgF family)
MTIFVQVALIASVFIVAAGVLGISLANARNSQKGQTEALYERENKALGQALNRQEQENARLLTKIEALVNSNAVLQETVSGTKAVRELAKEIADEERKRQEEHQTMQILLKDIIAELRQSRGALGR